MKKVGLLIGLLILGLAQPVFAVTVDELNDAWNKMHENKMAPQKVHALADKAIKENASDEEVVFIAHVVKSDTFISADKKNKEALAEAQILIDMRPESFMANMALASVYEGAKDNDAFLEQCKKAILFIKEGDPKKIKSPDDISKAKKEFTQFCEDRYYTNTAVSPAKIWNTYNENEAAGDEKYGGRTIAIKGKIAKIEKNMSGDYQAVFPIVDMSNVLCVIKGPEDNRSKLLQLSDKFDGKKPPKVQHPAAKLKRGQHVVFKGKVSGFALGNLVIEDCEVVE